MDLLRVVFKRLDDANLTVNLTKGDFVKVEIEYLGYVVGQSRVRPIAVKVSAINKFPVHTKRRELLRFVGMCRYYRRFRKRFLKSCSFLD